MGAGPKTRNTVNRLGDRLGGRVGGGNVRGRGAVTAGSGNLRSAQGGGRRGRGVSPACLWPSQMHVMSRCWQAFTVENHVVAPMATAFWYCSGNRVSLTVLQRNTGGDFMEE